MIPLAAVLSTAPRPWPLPPSRRAVLSAAALLALSACAGVALPTPDAPPVADGMFVMRDGARLPYRHWLPQGAPAVVALALHGFNDSRDAWEIPAVTLTEAGWAVYGPDQRGFGSAPGRGRWAGGATMVADAAELAAQVRALHPGVPLVLLGESMGGAVLMCLAAGPLAPADARYVLAAPAVWGRGQMNVILRASLWLGASLLPGMTLTGAPVRVTASDNHAALLRLSRDPLTIRATRVDTLRGLVDLMGAAAAAAPSFAASGLFLYGGRDELVPKAATAAAWRALPRDGRASLAYYPDDYHLILRDRGRAAPLGDMVAWVRSPGAPLPSGADSAARQWMASREA